MDIIGIAIFFYAVLSKDPEVGMNTSQIIQYWGYPVETHKVNTSDGYILTMYRIPHGKSKAGAPAANKPVAFLQHALLDSSFAWVLNLPTESLGYILADLGYDVWLGNNRGNKYSRAHVSLKVNSREFWNFTWDQMALFDLPAQVGYVLNHTNRTSVSYVGHSEGTIQMFANLAHSDQLWEKINYFAALGPVAYTYHLKSLPLVLLADLRVDLIFEMFGMKEFLTDEFLNYFGKIICSVMPDTCNIFIEVLCGPSQQANKTRMDIYIAETPSGTSVKNMAHWAQGVRVNKFNMFDYGSKRKNREHYGTDEPPEYDLTKIQKVPISLYSGSEDLLADPTDVSKLETDISYTTKTNLELYKYAHLDFTWGVNAYKDFYPHLIADMEQLNPTNV